jgi:AcrR family transcriptional regulator
MPKLAQRVTRPQRRVADAKENRILDAAQALFLRYGVKRTAIDDVAREAGIAKGTIYLYYDSKESLFRALAGRLANDARARIASALLGPGPAEERLAQALNAKIGYLHRMVRDTPHAAELMDSRTVAADIFDALSDDLNKAVAKVMKAEGIAAENSHMFFAAAMGELKLGEAGEGAYLARLTAHVAALLQALRR